MAKRNKRASIPQRGYPRPQLERKDWTSLNGPWDFAIDPDAKWTRPQVVQWDQQIQVPFAPETPLSGVENTGFFKAVWYRRMIDRPALARGQRVVLHFGAVDHVATV